MRLDELQTPCLVLDSGILERNLWRMSDRMRSLGVALRPHLKTAKSAQVARLAVNGEKGGITVSTLAEAEYFARHGFRDVTIAAALAPDKLDRAALLADGGASVTLVTDSVEGAQAIAAHPAKFRALIELDSGDNRAGIAPDSESLLVIAAALGGKLAGVMTHAGHSYDCRSLDCIREVAETERRSVVFAATRLRLAGFECPVVSVGSTPTMTHARTLEGVTEARPGVYMFQDLYQAAIGSCSSDDIALTVLASVISRAPSANRIVVDAGALALSKDRSTQVTDQDAGFGEVRDLGGVILAPGARVARAYQEHGVVTAVSPLPFDRLPIGARVRIAPNHACLTAAAHDVYYVVDGGDEITAVWDRVNGW